MGSEIFLDLKMNADDKELACQPLKTLEEIFSWDASNCPRWEVNCLKERTALSSLGTSQCCHRVSSEWRPQKLYDRTTVPKTLVCHDMKGGYLDDRFVYGTDKHSDYRFFHWAGIDIFVYFSHQLLTIPPPVWVNAAHLHGVLILGTLITEWEAGRQILEKILRGGEEMLQSFVSQLASISECYGLDGWLLNVENALDPEDIPQLQRLISLLTSAMHSRIPHSQVIWYDSIITTGELKWQNELNEKNRIFFDLCDGIFLNYAWKEKGLAKSVKEAGVRALDVYVGVDVYGRGCLGGGGFNTREAVEVARAHDLSVALFGPGWVHECWAVEKFTPLEYSFWRRLWPLLYIHGPTQLPYESSFCQGFGLRKYSHGKVIYELPWHNLSHQQPQPCLPSCVSENGLSGPPTTGGPSPCDGEQLRGCVQHWSTDAYLGGGCLLLLRPVTLETKEPVIHRLILCSFKVDASESLLVSYALKSPVPELVDVEADLSLWLMCQDRKRGTYRRECLGKVNKTNGREPLKPEQIITLQNDYPRLVKQLGESPENSWRVRHFVVPASEHSYRITEVCVTMGPQTVRTLFGWLAICSF